MQLGMEYWAWIGTFYLIILTYKDFKNNMNIDDRHNYFMMGATFVLMSHIYRSIWYILVLIIVTIALNLYLNKYNLIGGADVSTLTWIFYGFGLINPFYLLFFVLYFGVISLFYMFLKKIGLKIMRLPHNTPTPFYIVILISFITFSFFVKIY